MCRNYNELRFFFNYLFFKKYFSITVFSIFVVSNKRACQHSSPSIWEMWNYWQWNDVNVVPLFNIIATFTVNIAFKIVFQVAFRHKESQCKYWVLTETTWSIWVHSQNQLRTSALGYMRLPLSLAKPGRSMSTEKTALLVFVWKFTAGKDPFSEVSLLNTQRSDQIWQGFPFIGLEIFPC